MAPPGAYTPPVRPVTDRPLLKGMLLGVAHAAMMALAFPPVGFWPASLVAVAPLVLAGWSRGRAWRLGVGAASGTLPFWLLTHWWIWDISDAGLPVLLVYLALYPGLFVWTLARLCARDQRSKATVSAAVLWVGLEALRGMVVFHGYPWYLIGHPMIDAPIGFVGRTLGIYGSSLLAALVGVCAAAAWESRRVTPRATPVPPAATALSITLLCALGGLIHASFRADGPPSLPIRVAVVQPDIPQSNKDSPDFDTRMASFSEMLRFTSDAAHNQPPPDVIVWPETMFPGTSLCPEVVAEERRSGLGYRAADFALTGWHDTLVSLQRDLGIPMLVGASAYDDFRIVTDEHGPRFEHARVYNSAFVIHDGAVQPGRYDKRHLTPFGETMPYISAWKWLERKLLALGASGFAFDLSPGSGAGTISVPLIGPDGVSQTVSIAAPICFEATMPGVVRSLVRDHPPARMIVNITNDGWFGGSVAGRENHMLNARWRCLELGLPMVRAANTGISCLIDERGKVLQRGPNLGDDPHPSHGANTSGVMLVDTAASDPGGSTLYAATGDLAGRGCLLLSLLIAARALARSPVTLPAGASSANFSSSPGAAR